MEGNENNNEGDTDDDIELLADVRAHDRIPNPSDVMDLSDDSVTEISVVDDSEPQLKKTKTEVVVSVHDSKPATKAAMAPVEASECQICLETYTSGGDRRCVVTKCGHIFCFICISRVMTTRQPCPKCRKKLGKQNSLITIYDTAITVVDTSEVEEARRVGDEERAKRIQTDFALATSRLREKELLARLASMEGKVKELMFQKENAEKKNLSLKYRSNVAEHSLYDNVPGSNTSECSLGSSSSSSSSSRNVPNDTDASVNRRKSIAIECISKLPVAEGRVCKVVSFYTDHDSFLVGCTTNSVDVGRGVVKSYCIQLYMFREPNFEKFSQFGNFSSIVKDMATSNFAGQIHRGLLCVVTAENVSRLFSYKNSVQLFDLILGEYKGSCCTFSTSFMHQIWIGASQGTVLLFDLTPMYDPHSYANTLQSSNPTSSGLTQEHPRQLLPVKAFSIQNPLAVSLPKPPVQSITHVSDTAGCFSVWNRTDGDNDMVVSETVILTLAGKVWTLSSGSDGLIGINAAPKILEFFTLTSEPTAVLSYYDVRMSDVWTPSGPSLQYSADRGEDTYRDSGEEGRVSACLVVSSKAMDTSVSSSSPLCAPRTNSHPPIHTPTHTPALIQRFLLTRESSSRAWRGLIISKSFGHSFSLSLPKPVFNVITPAKHGSKTSMLVTVCPDEGTGSLCFWILPVQGLSNIACGERVTLTLQTTSPILSLALIPAKIKYRLIDPDVHPQPYRIIRAPPAGQGHNINQNINLNQHQIPGLVPSLRSPDIEDVNYVGTKLVVATAEGILIYSLQLTG